MSKSAALAKKRNSHAVSSGLKFKECADHGTRPRIALGQLSCGATNIAYAEGVVPARAGRRSTSWDSLALNFRVLQAVCSSHFHLRRDPNSRLDVLLPWTYPVTPTLKAVA